MTAYCEVEQRLLVSTKYLCDFCRNVLNTAIYLFEHFSLQDPDSPCESTSTRKIREIYASSSSGDCIICHRLAVQIREYNDSSIADFMHCNINHNELNFRINVRKSGNLLESTDRISVHVLIVDTVSGFDDSVYVEHSPCESSTCQFHLGAHCSDNLKGLRSVVWVDNLQSSHTTGSQEVFQTLKSCLSECINEHSECALSARGHPSLPTDRWIPTRLLQIAPDATRVRLVLQDEVATSPEYVALSHCWGQVEDRFRLTTSTISQLRQGIPVAQLPTLFRDSIAFAHNCGLKYIWIDSLCILQDSPEDWQRESALMSLVYENAVFTIAALVSTNDEDSLYRERNPRIDLGFKFLVLTERDEHSSDPSAKVDPTRKFTSDPQAERMLDHVCVRWETASSLISELHFPRVFNRVWVFQEKMLSRRIIGFGGFAAVWTCSEASNREGDPREEGMRSVGNHPRRQLRRLAEATSEMQRVQKVTGVQETPYSILAYWNAIVEHYSICVLTKPTDRLVALSAMANEFYMITTDRYFAGLWERGLVIGLAWEVCAYGINPAGAGPDFIAPTWSWASVNSGIVTHSNMQCHAVVEVCKRMSILYRRTRLLEKSKGVAL